MADKPYTAEQKIIDYQSVFTSEAGARILADLDVQGLYRRDLIDAHEDRWTNFNLGKNYMIRYIHSWIEKKITDEPEKKTVKDEGVKL